MFAKPSIDPERLKEVCLVQAPDNATILAPGYCMLFVVSGGVPSLGRWVRLAP
jgi:hypothetical protein